MDEPKTRETGGRRCDGLWRSSTRGGGRHRRCEYALACLLVAWDDRQCAASCGHTDTVTWARSVLGIEPRQTRDLLRIGRRLRDLPRLREVFSVGEVGWTQVREVVRVATPETDAAWTERVLEVGSRRLEREVAACRPGDLPPAPDDIELPSRVVLRFDVATGDAMVVRKALAVLKAQAGDGADEGVLLASLARIALRESHCEERPMPEERYRIVLQECPTCTQPRRLLPAPPTRGWFRAAPAARPTGVMKTAFIGSTGPSRKKRLATTSRSRRRQGGSLTPSRRRCGGE